MVLPTDKTFPFIGVTASIHPETGGPCFPPPYLSCLCESGAIPILLPLELDETRGKQITEVLDGILFTGGPDVHPFYFQEETLEGCGNHSPQRDTTEFLLFRLAFAQKKPILGICRGLQLINIALGGDLWQDIGTQVQRSTLLAHQQPFAPTIPSHHVSALPDTKLAAFFINQSMPPAVNSSHHQAVRTPASMLQVSAIASDGIIEALEHPSHPFLLGVQWHPELLYDSQPHAKLLFDCFVKHAAAAANR